MSQLQRIFILGSIMYLMTKACLAVILYLITIRIEKKAMAFKRKRLLIHQHRKELNQVEYKKQYANYERQKGQTSRRRRTEGPSLAFYGTKEWLEQIK